MLGSYLGDVFVSMHRRQVLVEALRRPIADGADEARVGLSGYVVTRRVRRKPFGGAEAPVAGVASEFASVDQRVLVQLGGRTPGGRTQFAFVLLLILVQLQRKRCVNAHPKF